MSDFIIVNFIIQTATFINCKILNRTVSIQLWFKQTGEKASFKSEAIALGNKTCNGKNA